MDDILCPGQTASEQRPANKVIQNMLSKCLDCLVGRQNKQPNGNGCAYCPLTMSVGRRTKSEGGAVMM